MFQSNQTAPVGQASAWLDSGGGGGGLSIADGPQERPLVMMISATVFSLLATLVLIQLGRLARRRRRLLGQLKQAGIAVAGAPKLFAGHLHCTLLRNDNLKRMDDFHKQLGKTYGLFYGQDAWVATVDLALIQRVFVTEGATHVDATLLRLPFVTEINESLAQVRGDKWRQTRRLMAASFTPSRMKSDNVFRDIEQAGDLFMGLLAAHERPLELDVNYAFKRYSMEVVFRIAYGRAHCERLEPHQRDQLIDWVDAGSQLVVGKLVSWAIMFGPLARLLLGLCSRFTALGACIRYVHSIAAQNLEARRKLMQARAELNEDDNHLTNPTAGEPKLDENGNAIAAGDGRPARVERRMIDSLIESFESGRLDDGTLRANLFFMLIAGFETSANTLTCMFWLLAKHPLEQERLRAELTRHGERAPYLDWVLSETLRLFPAVPAPIGRILEHDLEHEGRLLRRGLTVVASIWSLHRWPEYWGADAAHFKPERFGDAAANKRWPLRFFAFAAGPRYCIGQHLALAEIKALAARLLLKYRVAPPAGAPLEPLEPISPNMIHFIIREPIRLAFIELSQL